MKRDAPDWFDLENEPGARLLKSGHRRKTWRVETNDRCFFAKVFDIDLGGVLTIPPLLDPAHREWKALSKVAALGIPVPPPVTVGRNRQRMQSVVVTEALDDALPLSQAWDANCRVAHRRILGAVAQALSTAHQCGFLHPDLHPANLLLRANGAGDFQAVWLDVVSARFFRGALPFEFATRSIAQLDQSFQRIASRSERLRFLREYLALRVLPRNQLRSWVEGILRAKSAHAEKLARRRDRRLHRNGKYFASLRLGRGWRATVVLQLERRSLFPEAEVADHTIRQWRDRLVSLLGQSTPLPTSGQLLVGDLSVSGFTAGGLAERFAWTLRGSPARRTFDETHRRRHRDFPSELVLGFCERRTRAGLVECALVLRPSRVS